MLATRITCGYYAMICGLLQWIPLGCRHIRGLSTNIIATALTPVGRPHAEPLVAHLRVVDGRVEDLGAQAQPPRIKTPHR